MHEIYNPDFFWSLFIIILQTVIFITMADCLLMGILHPCFAKKCYPPCFLISRANRIDLQSGAECSAYAAAFVLRHFGREASGAELYEEIPCRRKDGSVYPKGVKKLLSRQGMKAVYCTGNLNALKREISNGRPPIVFIRTYPGKKWLHYVPVVGYDEFHFFLADSLPQLANSSENGYNRKVSNEEFRKLWNTSMWKMPLYRHTFFSVRYPEMEERLNKNGSNTGEKRK